jgi:hypothetical protein
MSLKKLFIGEGALSISIAISIHNAGAFVKAPVCSVCVKDLVGLFLNVNNHGGLVRVAPNMFITACEAGATTD